MHVLQCSRGVCSRHILKYPRLTCTHSLMFKRRISRQILKYPRLTCALSVMFNKDFEISEVY